MPSGKMEQAGSSDSAVGDDRISIGSPSDSRSSSTHTVSQENEQAPLQQRGQRTIDKKTSQDGGADEQRNTSEDRHQDSSVWLNPSPQSLDEEASSSNGGIGGGGGGAAAAVHDKTSSGSSEESPLNDSANNDNEQKDEPFAWTPYAEVHLLNALRGLRPVGANFNFQMNIIHARFEAGMGAYISRDELVRKLYTWYNFDEALRICGGEDIPTNQCEFSLPEEDFPEYSVLMKRYRPVRDK